MRRWAAAVVREGFLLTVTDMMMMWAQFVAHYGRFIRAS
jgi:hypothetical protein